MGFATAGAAVKADLAFATVLDQGAQAGNQEIGALSEEIIETELAVQRQR